MASNRGGVVVRRRPIERPLVVTGTFVHSLRLGDLQVIPDGAVGVGRDGRIVFVSQSGGKNEAEVNRLCKEHGLEDAEHIQLDHKSRQFCMPGMVDTHVHASQYPFSGTGYDLPLLQWLSKYTFPTEAKYREAAFAAEAYSQAVTRFVRNGTTTACYFATIHNESSLILAKTVEQVGQRAYIGKVCMDRNSPENYIETTGDSAESTRDFVKKVLEMKSDRVLPIITPRFVPSCTSELMQELGNIAEVFDVPVQSHLSESKAEIQWVSELHPDCSSYTEVYDKYNLLTNKTVMAHCVHLSDEEIELMKKRNTGVAHCPNSNFSIMSGIFSVRRLLEKGLKVGLGTDVAGGYSPSILDAARQAITMSKIMFTQTPKENAPMPLSYQDVLHLATLGGSEVLALDNVIGNFTVGKFFDALIISPCVDVLKLVLKLGTPIDIQSSDTTQDVISKFIFLGDDRNITHVFVAGDKIAGEDC